MPNTLSALPASTYKLSHDPTQSIAGDVQSDISDNPYAEMTDELLFGAVNTLLGDIDDATGLDLLAMVTPLEDLLGADHGLLSGLVGFLNPSSGTAGGGVLGPLLNLIPGLGGGTGTLGGLGDFLNPSSLLGDAAGILSPLFGGSIGSGNILGSLIPGLDASKITSGSFPLTMVTGLIDALEAGGAGLLDAVVNMFGGTGSGHTTGDLDTIGSNLLGLLGSSGLTSGSFDPVAAGQQMLENVLTPAGAITSFTQIPSHLFGNLQNSSSNSNLLPDGGFDHSDSISGLGLWDWSSVGRTKPGSAHTTGAGVLRELIGVAIATVPGDVTNLASWVKWSGVTASTGSAFRLCANAYDIDGNIISDPTNRVVQAITSPGAASTSYSGHDGAGWVNLSGSYQAPTGCCWVRFCFEVDMVVAVGDVWVDDCLHQLQSGLIDASILKNLSNIGTLFPETMAGFQGITNLVNTFQHMVDGLGSAFHPDGEVSGIDFTDLFSLAQGQTQAAILAQQLAAISTQILGIRTNKPASQGANSTSQSSFDIGHFTNPASGTQTTTSLTTGNAMAQRFTVPEDASYGFMEFQIGCASPASVYFNIYKIDPVTNAKATLWNSVESSSLIPTSVNHVRVLLPSMPASLASDVLLFEVVNNGATPLTVVSKTTGAPNNTNEVMQNVGFARTVAAGGTSPASGLTSGQGAYSGTVPYAVIGLANVPANYHPPQRVDYTTAQTTTAAYPSWLRTGDFVDIIGIGGGGGGACSFFAVIGNGGIAAIWGTQRLVYGVDIKVGSTYTLTVGNRGNGGTSSNGGPGGNTTFTYTDPSNVTHTITAAGGAGASGVGGPATGQAANNITVDGITFFGGTSVVAATGQSPGGGGSGAASYGTGWGGGVGQLSLYMKQPV